MTCHMLVMSQDQVNAAVGDRMRCSEEEVVQDDKALSANVSNSRSS